MKTKLVNENFKIDEFKDFIEDDFFMVGTIEEAIKKAEKRRNK